MKKGISEMLKQIKDSIRERPQLARVIIAGSFIFPIMASIGRAGIVELTLEEAKVHEELSWAIFGVMAASYFALFSGNVYAMFRCQLDRDIDEAAGGEGEPLIPVEQVAKYHIQSSAFRGRVGYASGILLALAEGWLNFLGMAHVISHIKNQQDVDVFASNDIYIAGLFGSCSLVCWFSTVPYKVQSIMADPEKEFKLLGEQEVPRKVCIAMIWGLLIGFSAGIGLGLTGLFGILRSCYLFSITFSNPIAYWVALLIGGLPTLGTMFAGALFYIWCNFDLAINMQAKLEGLRQLLGSTHIFDLIKLFVGLGFMGIGAYATGVLSYISDTVSFKSFSVQSFYPKDYNQYELPVALSALNYTMAVALAFTATAVSGSLVFKFIHSLYYGNPAAVVNDPRKTKMVGVSHYFDFFRTFYRNKLIERMQTNKQVYQPNN